MFGMLKRFGQDKLIKSYVNDYDHFFKKLDRFDNISLGYLLCFAAHQRHILEENTGINLLNPSHVIEKYPNAVLNISQLANDFQKKNQTMISAGLMVWLHTLRSFLMADRRHELDFIARTLWDRLEWGFGEVEHANSLIQRESGLRLNIEGASTRPLGV
jgi:hypothetical protein